MAKILVVDDETEVCNHLREYLSNAGYEVGVAEDADKAIRMLVAENFDVVVSDIILGKRSGVDLLKSIRKKSLPVEVILMTGLSTLETAFEALRVGAFDYLVKPFGRKEFLKTVANAAKVKALDDERQLLTEENRNYRENLEDLVKERTAALGKREELLRETGRITKVGGWEHNLATDEVSWTDEVYRIFGVPLNAKPPKEESIKFVHPEDRPKLETALKKAFEHGEPYDMEYRLITAKGKHLWTHCICKPVTEEGRTVKISGIIQDITDRKQAEISLHESEERFRGAFDTAAQGMALVSPSGNFLKVNRALCDIVGYSEEELLAASFQSLTHAEDLDEDIVYINQVLAGEIKSYEMEKRYFHKEGHVVWVLLSVSLVKNISGKPLYFVSQIQDITERKRAEKALSQATNIINRSPSVAFLWKNEESWPVEYVSENVEQLFGYSKREFMEGKISYGQIIHDDDIERVAGEVATSSETEGKQTFTHEPYRILTKKGEIKWIEDSTYICRDFQGKITHYEGIVRDITERKQAEELAGRFHRVLENSLEEIYIFNAETFQFVEVNRGARENLGYSMEDLSVLTPLDLKPEFTVEAFAELLEPLRAGIEEKIQFTTFHRRKDGSQYPVEIHLQLMTDDTPLFLSIVLDITARKQAETERERLTHAIAQVGEAIVMTDIRGAIDYVNPAFERITGYTSKEVMGQNMRIIKSSEQDNAFYEEMWATITNGQTWSGRIVNKKKDGTLYTEEMVISPVRDVSGRTVNYVGVKRDITKEIKLDKQLFQAQKMESVGRLAGGVAHDFNNILQTISGFSELMLLEMDSQPAQRQDVIEILKATKLAGDLTRQLLVFSRKQPTEIKRIDLNQVLSAGKKMLQQGLDENTHLHLELEPQLKHLNADASQIFQVAMNLIINARDAMPAGGHITLRTQNVEFTEKDLVELPNSRVGKFVCLSVSDTGCGMNEDQLTHLFEPFYTTKELGKGTGLGLSVVYGIVRESRGWVSVSSELGRGSAFKVYLPRYNSVEQETLSGKGVSTDKDASAGKRILQVEDDIVLRETPR